MTPPLSTTAVRAGVLCYNAGTSQSKRVQQIVFNRGDSLNRLDWSMLQYALETTIFSNPCAHCG